MTATPRALARLDKQSPHAAALAELASLAVRIDSGLLRRLRQRLLPQADVSVESDLWFSAIVESRGPSGFQIAPDVVAVLRDRLAASQNLPGQTERVKRVRGVLAEAHRSASPAIALEETVNGIAVEKGNAGLAEIEAKLRPALRTLAAAGAASLDVARWAVHAEPRFHPVVRRSSTGRALTIAATLVLRTRHTSEPMSGLTIEEIAWALPPLDATTRQVGVVFVHGGLQFRQPAEGVTAVDVPATDPALVELEWESTGATRRTLAEATPGVIAGLEGAPDTVTLTTLSGERWRLRASTRPGGKADAAAPPSLELLGACALVSLDGIARIAFAIERSLLLTVASPFAAATTLLSGGRPLDVIRASRERADDFVALTPRGWQTPLSLEIADAPPDGDVHARVAGVVNGEARWFDLVVPRHSGRSPAPRSAFLLHAPFLTDEGINGAFGGAPIVFEGRVIGAVIQAELLPTAPGQLRYADPDALREIVVRARAASGAITPIKAFISANQEMLPFRESARRTLARLNVEVTGMETLLATASGGLEAIAASDLFIAFVGWRYGTGPPGAPEGLSYLHQEYRHAKALGKQTLIFVTRSDPPPSLSESPDALKRMHAFREELQHNEKPFLVRTEDDVEERLTDAVARYLNERTVAGAVKESHAFVVGVEDYPEARQFEPRVPGARAAGETLRAALSEQLQIPPERTHVLLGHVTRRDVVGQVERLIDRWRDRMSQLFFVFCGYVFGTPDAPDDLFMVTSDFSDPVISGPACTRLLELQQLLKHALGPGDHYYFVFGPRIDTPQVDVRRAALGIPDQHSVRGEPTVYTLDLSGPERSGVARDADVLAMGIRGTSMAEIRLDDGRVGVTFDNLANHVRASTGTEVSRRVEGPGAGILWSREAPGADRPPGVDDALFPNGRAIRGREQFREWMRRLRDTYPIAVVTGPPGSGKSMTIQVLRSGSNSEAFELVVVDAMHTTTVDDVAVAIAERLNARDALRPPQTSQRVRELVNALLRSMQSRKTPLVLAIDNVDALASGPEMREFVDTLMEAIASRTAPATVALVLIGWTGTIPPRIEPRVWREELTGPAPTAAPEDVPEMMDSAAKRPDRPPSGVRTGGPSQPFFQGQSIKGRAPSAPGARQPPPGVRRRAAAQKARTRKTRKR